MHQALFCSGEYAPRFTRTDYAPAFEEYCARFASVVAQALETQGVETIARGVVTAMDERWSGLRWWHRARVQSQDKAVVVQFFTPLLLAQGHDALAQEVCRQWGERWPKNGYRCVPFARLHKGFRNAIMGFDVGQKEEEDG